uniref:Uncharacterized protein n=1 Tax=Anguilla anguilla TaxID=7936 RepID=A0A0E9PZY8_ANGAN
MWNPCGIFSQSVTCVKHSSAGTLEKPTDTPQCTSTGCPGPMTSLLSVKQES